MQFRAILGSLILSLSVSFSPEIFAQATGDTGKLPFRVSEETTFITEPLTEGGLVDYAAHLNRVMGQGVTPETNAAVLYWKVIGKTDDVRHNPELYEKMKRALGVEEFEDNHPSLVSLGKIAEEAGVELDFNEGSTLGTQYHLSMERPWTSKEAPLIRKWLEANDKPLETVLAATRRPHYFRPLVSVDESESMIAMLLPDVQQHREMARMLKARALLAIGEDRPQEAIRDLLAIHRLARHSAQGATLIEMLVGVAIEGVAHDGDRQLVNSESVTAGELAGYAKQLSQLPPPADISRSYQTERFFGLDVVQRLATQQFTESEDQGDMMEVLGLQFGSETMSKLASLFFQYGIDWNVVLIGFNEYHDRVQSALEDERFARRRAAMEELTSEFRTTLQQVNKPANLALAIFATPEQRGEQMKTILLALLAPALEQAHEAGTRGETKADLSQIGAALAAHRRANGTFAESLDALVPAYLPVLPHDPYTGNPFVYRVDDEGALLYSLGKNLKDDGGKPVDDDYGNHDHVFRVNRRESR